MMPVSICVMFPAGSDIPYAFSRPGSPSARLANSPSTHSVTAPGSDFDRAVTSERVFVRYFL
ncbi:hypothetical protein STENM223S_05740 [Streptomyces tendae]